MAELTCHLIKTRSICVKNIWIFARFLKLLRSCWEKSRKTWGDTEKNKEKLGANCTGFSAEFFGSQSVEMFGFARKTKIQMLTTSCWSQFSLRLSFLKYLRLYSIHDGYIAWKYLDQWIQMVSTLHPKLWNSKSKYICKKNIFIMVIC